METQCNPISACNLQSFQKDELPLQDYSTCLYSLQKLRWEVQCNAHEKKL